MLKTRSTGQHATRKQELTRAEIQQLRPKEMEQLIIDRLETYGKNLARIEFLQQTRSIGHGMHLDLYTSSISDAPDVLSVLHQKLQRLPEHAYLTEHEQTLAKTYRSYMYNKRHSLALSSNLKQLRSLKEREVATGRTRYSHNEEENQQLRLMEQKLQFVVDSRNDRLTLQDKLQDEVLQEEVEIQQLRKENYEIEYTLQRLAMLKPDYHKLIRLRYIEGKSVPETREALDNISDSTYRRWRIDSFDYMARVLYGYNFFGKLSEK